MSDRQDKVFDELLEKEARIKEIASARYLGDSDIPMTFWDRLEAGAGTAYHFHEINSSDELREWVDVASEGVAATLIELGWTPPHD